MTDKMHRFKVDDWVDIVPSTLRSAEPGRYRIVRLIPCDADDPRYCLRSPNETHDRILSERDLRAVNEAVE
jgi:hypothetical protein